MTLLEAFNRFATLSRERTDLAWMQDFPGEREKLLRDIPEMIKAGKNEEWTYCEYEQAENRIRRSPTPDKITQPPTST